MLVNWGIIGCGLISHDFCLSIIRGKSSRHRLVACASKTKCVKTFAEKFKIPKFYDTYENLIADPEISLLNFIRIKQKEVYFLSFLSFIDAVYIGNLVRDHKEWTIKAMEAGKAVLCEKPLTMSEVDTRAVVEASRRLQVLMIEGVWARFNPVYIRIRQILESGNIAAAVQANFTVPFMVDRMVKPEVGFVYLSQSRFFFITTIVPFIGVERHMNLESIVFNWQL